MVTPTFTSEDTFTITGRGRVFCVRLDRDTPDFMHLLGKPVVIDDVLWQCTGVEHRAIAGPFKAGTGIGLLVNEPTRSTHKED